MDKAQQAASKRNAGYHAAGMVEDGTVIGRAGSTVFFAMERLGERIAEDGLSITGVPTSYQAAIRAHQYGIPLSSLDGIPNSIWPSTEQTRPTRISA